MRSDIIVLKFGSSVLRTLSDLPTAVHEIYRWYRAGWRVVIVVSAIGDATDALLSEGHALTPVPEPNAVADLLATAERRSAALLGIALNRVGVPARVLDPRDIGLIAEGSPLDSEPVGMDRERADALLAAHSVLVLPGFFGYTSQGRLHLLGRGGSDLSAVCIAQGLIANRCRLLKDVDGVYETDPAAVDRATARRFHSLGYADALACAGPLIQPKAVRYLERHQASVEVSGIASPFESVIGQFGCQFDDSRPSSPTAVLLLGLGTVGFGVYQRLIAMPDHFRIAGVLVRDHGKYIALGVPSDLLYESVDDVTALPADVVVDALSGVELSRALIEQSLVRGINVVTANKIVVAEEGRALVRLASGHDARLLYSAAVGGSAPMLEALRRNAQPGQVRCVAGILNGTCNYILDRFSQGLLFREAQDLARAHGFAEADSTEDLSGRDAARKLRIVVRHAFGEEIAGLAIEPLNAAAVLRARATLHADETLRMIARAWKLGSRVFGQIQIEAVATKDAFGQTCDEWNKLIVTTANGKDLEVCGRGAGRWPTTEAVVADLLELRLAKRH